MELYDIYFLVGIPACGKSTYAAKLKEELEAQYSRKVHIVSSDAIRGELYGDESIQKDPKRVFKLLYERVDAYLAADESVIIDNTGIQAKYRKQVCQTYEKYSKCAIIIPAFIEDCIARDKLRSRHVGEEVIMRFARQFEPPTKSEGWQNVIIYYDNSNYLQHNVDILEKMKDFNQQNHHHSLDLYQHCAMTREKVIEKTTFSAVTQAAELHDIGKLYTQTFKNGEAHYYNHHNVSAYLSYLFPSSSYYCTLLRAALIAHHMDFYFTKDCTQLRIQLENIYPQGEYPGFYEYLEILHEADESAH